MRHVDDAEFARAVREFRGLMLATMAHFKHLKWMDGELEQAALIGLWEAIGKLDRDFLPVEQRNFLIRMIRSRIWWDAVDLGLIVDHKNGHRRQRALCDLTLDEPVEDGPTTRGDLLRDPCDLDEEVVAAALLRGLKQALTGQPAANGRSRDRRWQALGMHAVFGFSVNAIAAMLGCSPSAAQSLLSRAKRDARRFVEERWAD